MTASPATVHRKVTLYRNGSVYTAADPFATAMLVDGDTVAWVGSEQAATSIADSSMDGHRSAGRASGTGLRRFPRPPDGNRHCAGLAPAGRRPLGRGAARRRRRLAAAAGPVLGHGWDETRGTIPPCLRADELERAAGGRQVYLSRVDAHSALVSRPRWPPPRGLEDLDGYAAGSQVKRAAHTAARRAARQLPAATLRGYQRRALAEAAANGYVAAGRDGALRTSEASRTCGSRRPGTAAAGRSRRPCRKSCRTGASWPPLRTHARSILDGLGVSGSGPGR